MEKLRELIIRTDETEFYNDTKIIFYFHKWITRYHGRDGKGDEVPCALIEAQDGTMMIVKYYNIKFKEKP